MRPYKMVLGCTQVLCSTAATEIIKFQLYSQQDYLSLKLSVQNNMKILEQDVKGDISCISLSQPEISCSKTSLPFISWYIKISDSDVSKLLNLVKQLFPKQLYIEVQ